MQKAGHIPLLLKNDDMFKLELPCTKYHSEPSIPSERYMINRLAMSYNEYSKKYWEQVRERHAIYRQERNLEI
jgi:hypothetical protein